MHLLICAQKVDKNDTVFGFFHRWIEEFAKHVDTLTVVCIAKGEYALPENVTVVSLGKEKGYSRMRVSLNFLRTIVQLRKTYDAVFVHMSAEYLLLGGIFWKLWKKPTALWYNHKKGSIYLRGTAWIPQVIFHTSPDAYTARYKKAVLAPAGIDTEQFRPSESAISSNSVLFLGRISPVKHVDDFVRAISLLGSRGVSAKVSIVGDISKIDTAYGEKIKADAKPLIEKGVLTWSAGVTHEKTPLVYANHAVYVNLTPSGSFDKTILEAMATGMLCIVTNTSFRELLPAWAIVRDGDSTGVAEAIGRAVSLPVAEREELSVAVREYVEKNHALSATVRTVLTHLSK